MRESASAELAVKGFSTTTGDGFIRTVYWQVECSEQG